MLRMKVDKAFVDSGMEEACGRKDSPFGSRRAARPGGEPPIVARREHSMFRRILVPLDGTKRAEEAIPFARELASSAEAQIFLLHVEPQMAAVLDEIAIDNRLEVIADEPRAAG